MGASITATTATAADPGGTAFVDEESATTGTDGASISSRRTEMLGGVLRFRGTLPSVGAGAPISIQRLDRRRGWITLLTTTAGQGGTFDASWQTDRAGRTPVRAVPVQAAGEAQAASAGPSRVVTVFRPAVATWFGPGFYGRRTACGQRMTRKLLGVAHRTLPCGTRVDVFYEGQTITVPVVDRGPFRKGTTWDLTAATAKALGFTHTDTIGAVRVPKVAVPTVG